MTWDFQNMHLGGSSPLNSNPRSAPPGKIHLEIGLPLDYGSSIPKRMSAIVSDDMDVEELNYRLARRLGVNENRWKLIVISDENGPRALDKRCKLIDIKSNKEERLYFAPEIRVR